MSGFGVQSAGTGSGNWNWGGEAWEQERRRREELLRCHNCKGANTMTCQCAKRAWESSRQGVVSVGVLVDPWVPSHSVDLEREWYNLTQTCVGVAAICNYCGGSSMSTCACAKTRWMAEQKAKGRK